MPAKILGQITGKGVSTAALVYTCPAGKQVVVSTFVAVNTSSSTARLRNIYIGPGSSLAAEKIVLSELSVPANTRVAITEGWCMSAGDQIRVIAEDAFSVSVFGAEDPA